MTKVAVDWRIYYSDGTTYDSNDGKPHTAPAVGIIVIVQKHEDVRERPYIQHKCDHYVWLGRRWLGCDQYRLWQYLYLDHIRHKYDFPRAALLGETTDNDNYQKIIRRAKSDRDFFPP